MHLMPGAPPRIALIACDVLQQEVEHHSGTAPVAVTQWFEMGLHDRPDVLRGKLQAAIDELDTRADLDAIALVYGLCGLGTAGLFARRLPLVIPRAHDCITLFLGSKERYAAYQAQCPSCYWYSPGWNRTRRVPGPERLAMLRADLEEKYGADNAEFLLETEREIWSTHDTVAYVDLATANADQEAAYAKSCAEWLNWKFERLTGDPTLLRDLLQGNWHDEARFQIIPPGHCLRHSPDERIMRAEPPPADPS
jgi:hypothetical protein